ncbi:MAG: 30S ribosome-binding factor RbfA [Deltaproteobacteria bacterium]|nr:30S ribosome-binding factor RbfA [Deltaproteobacteria bacterium]
MKPYTRADRVSGLIQETLADILRKSIKDPRLASVLITKIRMTADLKLAKIYYVTAGQVADRESTAEGFKKASGFIRRALGKELDLRYIPDLHFLYDASIDYGIHMNQILSQLDHES